MLIFKECIIHNNVFGRIFVPCTVPMAEFRTPRLGYHPHCRAEGKPPEFIPRELQGGGGGGGGGSEGMQCSIMLT